METAESHLSAAEQELRQGHARAALDEARAALRLQPEGAQAHAMIGLAHTLMGDEDEARASFAKATDLAPRDPKIRYQFYLALGRMRDVQGARAQLTYFCELEPKNSEAKTLLMRVGGPRTDIPSLPTPPRAAHWYDGTGHSVTDAEDFEDEDTSDAAEPPPGPDVTLCPECSKRTWKGWFCKHCGGNLNRV